MAIAVIDIGKTNAKVVLVDAAGQEIDARRRANVVTPGPPYPHFDTVALWSFVLAALRDFAPQVGAIVPVTHGACAALVDRAGSLALPVLDYEFDAADIRADYAPPPFEETGSPPLAGGLNVGVQLNWLERSFPDAFARAQTLLFWPQWWAFRLTGIAAAEVTYLGCHTDLWMPRTGRLSRLAVGRDWDRLVPDIRRADERLGPVLPDIAVAAGLDPQTPVLTGIHDSNASLLPYLDATPCGVVSTGTWVVAMALGGAQDIALDPEQNMLLNVAADGRAVPTANFMGGRERDAALMAGTSAEDADRDIARRTAARLDAIGARGPVHVEGPFAMSTAFIDELHDRLGRDVVAHGEGAGTTRGAAMLVEGFRQSGSGKT